MLLAMLILADDIGQVVVIALLVLVGFGMMLFLLTLSQFFGLWVQALAAGKPISLAAMIGMQLRKSGLGLLVRAAIRAHKAGLDLTVQQLEAHKLSGGRPDAVVDAMIAGGDAGVVVTYDQLCELDLAGYDVGKALAIAVENRITAEELTTDFFDAIDAPRWDQTPRPSLE